MWGAGISAGFGVGAISLVHVWVMGVGGAGSSLQGVSFNAGASGREAGGCVYVGGGVVDD